jgi:hypothetical protein
VLLEPLPFVFLVWALVSLSLFSVFWPFIFFRLPASGPVSKNSQTFI